MVDRYPTACAIWGAEAENVIITWPTLTNVNGFRNTLPKCRNPRARRHEPTKNAQRQNSGNCGTRELRSGNAAPAVPRGG